MRKVASNYLHGERVFPANVEKATGKNTTNIQTASKMKLFHPVYLIIALYANLYENEEAEIERRRERNNEWTDDEKKINQT